jgi:uncharacterized protein
MTSRASIEQLIERLVAGSPLPLDEADWGELDTVGVHGRTPLMAAAFQGRPEAVEALVRKGASIDASGAQRMTALHEASANGHTAVVTVLLSLGADIDALTVDGVTPLMCAAAWGNLDVAKVLLEKGADSSGWIVWEPRRRTLRARRAKMPLQT